MRATSLPLPLLLLLLLWGVGSHGFPAASLRAQEQDAELVQNYLRKYYHLRTGTSKPGRQRNSSLVTEKLKQMQAFYGLKVTGKVDADTLALMRQPRCGVPDVAPYALGERTLHWEHTHLTYRLENYTPDLPRADVDRVIDRAFQLWSNASALTFTRVFEGQADIMISFVRGDHNDNNPFSGPENIIAHAFPPGEGIGGDVHFDEEKRWTKDFRDFNLYHVAAHEVGHSLGLLHNGDIESLMFSSYNYYGDNLLTQRDIDAIQALYGSSKNPIQPRECQVPQACESKLTFDAITEIRGELYFFKNRFFLRTRPFYKTGELGAITDFWVPLSRGIDAAYEVASRDEVFFFKDSKVWAFNAVKMRRGYPKDIYHSLGFPHTVKSIDAAVHEEETGKTYFFVASKYWRYDENTRSMDTGFPKEIAHGFPGIGKKVDAVFQERGFFYFFRGKRQYKFDPHTKRILTILNINSWFNCRNK